MFRFSRCIHNSIVQAARAIFARNTCRAFKYKLFCTRRDIFHNFKYQTLKVSFHFIIDVFINDFQPSL